MCRFLTKLTKKQITQAEKQLFAELFFHPFAIDRNGQVTIVDMRDSQTSVRMISDSAKIYDPRTDTALSETTKALYEHSKVNRFEDE